VRLVVALAFGPRQGEVLGLNNDRGWTSRASRCGSARTCGDALRSQFSSGVGDMEFRERAVRMVVEVRPNHETEWAAIAAIAAKLGDGSSERSASGSSGRDRRGQRPGLTSQEPAEIGRPRAEVREPHRADEILKLASAFFAAGLDRPRPTSWDSSTSTKMCSGRLAADYQLYGAQKTWRLPGAGPTATEPWGTMRLTVNQAVRDDQK
jgi:transposase